MPPPLLRLAERSYVATPLLHRHSFYQLVFPQRGQLRLRIEGHELAVGAQGWAVIHPEMAHLFWSEGENRFLVADLAADAVLQARDQLGLGASAGAVLLPLDERPAALAALLRSELAAGAAAEALVAETLGGYLGALLARALAPGPPPALAPARLIALRARDYLEAHALGPLRLAEVAAAVGVSEAHLQRCFRAHFATSLLDAIQARRLRAARHLLEQTDMPIHAVAAAVGFASQSYFSRLFTREVGLSPARYRRR